MRQALHIFKKDVRYLRYEIALVLLISGAFAAMHARASHGLSNDTWWAQLALVVAGAFLIGRLVLAEAIPGDRQFWITRPYRWQSLVGAKILFILTFLNLPVLMAQLFIVTIDGFPLASSLPGLLWSQVLLFAIAALPFTAIAALNSSMTPFIFTQITILAVVFGPWEMRRPLYVAQLGGVEWVRDSTAAVALAAVVILVILIQYKTRRTVFSRYVGLGGIAIVVLIYSALPWPFALAVQSRLSKQPSAGSSIRLALGHQPGERAWLASMKPKVTLHLPVSVKGIPDGLELQPDALSISFEGAGGRGTESEIADCPELRRETNSATAVTILAVCLIDPAFFHSQQSQPVTLRASLYFTLFGNGRSKTIPLSDEPANALDGLQCYTDTVRAEWDVYCRSAFRWPARLVYAKLGDTNANSFAQIVSYSPFPAGLNIEPVETRWASAFASGPPPTVHDVTIVVKEPLVHLRRELEARGVRLDELAFSSVHYLPNPPIRTP
jgi:hypothetical protein